MRDYVEFLVDTWQFVHKVLPDASEEEQIQAMKAIIENLAFLFDEQGNKQ